MEHGFLSRSLENTAHLDEIDLTTHWNLRDRHIQSLMLAMHADLEDGSPAGPLYGESLGLTLGLYLIRRYSTRSRSNSLQLTDGMPTARLNRVLDFINQNYAQDLRLWELAALAGMSPHYFCELFKASTGLTAYQYVMSCSAESNVQRDTFGIHNSASVMRASRLASPTKVISQRSFAGRLELRP
jgi:AraC family transcriptional regulator